MQGSSFQMPEGSEAATSPLEPICIPGTQGNKYIIAAQTHDSVDINNDPYDILLEVGYSWSR